MKALNYDCPHCGRAVTVAIGSVTQGEVVNPYKGPHGIHGVQVTFLVCPNDACRNYTLDVMLMELSRVPSTATLERVDRKIVKTWRLVPPSSAKVFPGYVPKVIRDDYTEACAIIDHSPRASATLARRALQGMVRDFWEAKGKNLYEEINSIQSKVDPETWDAIHAARKMGNIGAHMEKDVNVIIDVEPNEAKLLVTLVERLIYDWYIAREERRKHLSDIKAVAADKKPERVPPAKRSRK